MGIRYKLNAATWVKVCVLDLPSPTPVIQSMMASAIAEVTALPNTLLFSDLLNDDKQAQMANGQFRP